MARGAALLPAPAPSPAGQYCPVIGPGAGRHVPPRGQWEPDSAPGVPSAPARTWLPRADAVLWVGSPPEPCRNPPGTGRSLWACRSRRALRSRLPGVWRVGERALSRYSGSCPRAALPRPLPCCRPGPPILPREPPQPGGAARGAAGCAGTRRLSAPVWGVVAAPCGT